MSIEFDPDECKLIAADGSPLPRITGIETEYGIAHPDALSDDTKRSRLLLNGIGHKASQIRGRDFGEDGARVYLDINDKPEYSTPEGNVFIDTAHRVLHGHVYMADLYRQAAEEFGHEQYKESGYSFNTNLFTMYSNTLSPIGVSWGNHENFLARRQLDPEDYVLPLALHRLSRIVLSGTGSVLVLPDDTDAYHYQLSEKADHIWDVSSGATTSSRQLVNLKDEPLADKEIFRRIHNVTGESNMSAWAIAQRLASESIVLRAAEIKVEFDDLMPEHPVKAMRQISYDPDLKKLVTLEDGRRFTGVDLQLAIAERALSNTTELDYITTEEVYWGDEWITALDDLKRDPNSCADRVDWVVKRKLIERELEAEEHKGETPRLVALSKALNYHQLLPVEGIGMKLVRKGIFKHSPTPDELKNGIPLPQTRAKLRGEVIGSKQRSSADNAYDDWDTVGVTKDDQQMAIRLGNPYVYEDSRVSEFLPKIA